MGKRTRDRQLAKLAARRQAERQAAKRRRGLLLGGVAGAVAIALVVIGLNILLGDDVIDASSPSASASVSASATPKAKPGTQIGTVTPTVTPAEKVACNGKVPEQAGTPKPQFNAPSRKTIDPQATYVATMKTSCGTIKLKLLPDVAPVGVSSFVFLAREGFFDGLTFHRIVKGFVVQGGDPQGDGLGNAGYEFDIETSKKVTFDRAGLLAYANSGPGSNGSQFFITLDKTPQLDPTPQASYTVLGEVTRGMGVLRQLGDVPAGPNPAIAGEKSVPKRAVYIESVTIAKKK